LERAGAGLVAPDELVNLSYQKNGTAESGAELHDQGVKGDCFLNVAADELGDFVDARDSFPDPRESDFRRESLQVVTDILVANGAGFFVEDQEIA
jgi:hypothetical protein